MTYQPLISVVIPCFNHGRFLAEALQSVNSQDYPNKEIIVVDDGSTDDTAAVAAGFPSVNYVYQENSGLAAARNTGILHAHGEYLIFLDADDLFLPGVLTLQESIMRQHPDIAFASGGHITANEQLENRNTVSSEIKSNYYENLLRGNYIGMHGAVIYRSEIFRTLQFDPSLKACEDYDLYLKVAARYPVFNHKAPIAIYRSHTSNMSANVSMMLEMVLFVLRRHRSELRSQAQVDAYEEGIDNWINFYTYHTYRLLTRREEPVPMPVRSKFLRFLIRNKPKLYVRYYLHQIRGLLKSF
jgi:glycosyltransferase involved in cell wall biosynthesis